MATVLACSVVSGSPDIVSLRCRVVELIAPRARPPVFSTGTRCIHSSVDIGKDAARVVYIGGGSIDLQARPAIFFNPFFFLVECRLEANSLFHSWLLARSDRSEFLRPLAGRVLVCDCNRGVDCHTTVLVDWVHRTFPERPATTEPHEEACRKQNSRSVSRRPAPSHRPPF